LVTLADGSGLAAAAAVARWGKNQVRRYVPIAALGIAVALGLLAFAGNSFLMPVVLVLAGISESVAAVLSTASINESVEATEQGAAIALSGVYRAGARSLAPALVGGSLLVVGIPAALGLLAALVMVPGIWLWRAPGTSAHAS
jgi:MFS family permease